MNSVSVSPSESSVVQGGTKQLKATVDAVGGAATTVNWSSSDTNHKVTVDNTGLVSAAADAATGDYMITATSTADGTKKGTATITVNPVTVSVTGVKLDRSTLTLAVGGSGETLTATVAPSDATNKSVTWSSSNPGVATVAGGVVTPVAVGTATITATTADGGHTATSAVTVNPATVSVTGVTLDKPTLTLTADGVSETLTATVAPTDATDKNVTWSSSNPGVATVAGGVVTPVAAGTATITVTTADGGFTATSEVTVDSAPPTPVAVTGVALDQPTLSLTAGGATAALKATVAPTDATNQDVTWSSSDPSVATVADGVVTPVAAGTATITVTTADGGFTVTSEVTVDSAPPTPVAVTGVALDQPTLSLTAGGATAALKATVAPTDAANQDVTWSSSDPGVATVADGVVTPVAAGTATITVTTADGGFTATSEVTVANPPPVNVPASPVTPSEPANNDVEVLVNGKVENAGTATTSTVNDQTVTTVAVDPDKLDEKLAAEGDNAVVTIPVNTGSDVVVGELNGQMVKNMEQKQAVVEIKTEHASYTLPARQIDIDSISGQLGQQVDLKDIKIRILIAAPTADAVKVVEDAASQGGFNLVVPPVEFTVQGTYGGQTVDISRFDAYVERTIAIPDGVDPDKITTGVVTDPDGAVRHVPTKITMIDGKYYAVINSLTNSTYSVVWHPVAFTDVREHWAKDAVNDMGSRMVIDGTGDGLFSPDQNITRAEFAAIIVRALGLKLEQSQSAFTDVDNAAWYAGAVQTAYDYKLISGFDGGLFHPMDKITREQAMVMIDKAMALTGLKAKLPVQSADEVLRAFADASDASAWAVDGIVDCVQAGIVSGRNGMKLAPGAEITRAEAATMIEKLLQKSGLI